MMAFTGRGSAREDCNTWVYMCIRGMCLLAGFFWVLPVLPWQVDQPTPQPRQRPNEDPAAVGRGRALFKSSCGFCHGNDATGSRAPDLVRSAIVNHDDQGNLLAPVIRNG